MTGSPIFEEGLAVDGLYENSLQALYEFNPILDNQLIYRKQRFGKHVEIFFVDYRSYREPNPDNSNPEGSTMMGQEQLEWFKKGLSESTATWKIISSHDPLGVVTGGPGDRDAFGQEDPAILGREVELQGILEMIHDSGITGVISLTSDVHFTAHVEMNPDRAEGNWTDFNPLDEFVIGPIHAGSFGPNFLDTSFGAEYVYGTFRMAGVAVILLDHGSALFSHSFAFFELCDRIRSLDGWLSALGQPSSLSVGLAVVWPCFGV